MGASEFEHLVHELYKFLDEKNVEAPGQSWTSPREHKYLCGDIGFDAIMASLAMLYYRVCRPHADDPVKYFDDYQLIKERKFLAYLKNLKASTTYKDSVKISGSFDSLIRCRTRDDLKAFQTKYYVAWQFLCVTMDCYVVIPFTYNNSSYILDALNWLGKTFPARFDVEFLWGLCVNWLSQFNKYR